MERVELAAALSILFALSTPAHAEPEAIRFDYHAPAGCPDEQAFTDRVKARTHQLTLGSSRGASRTMAVSLTVNDGESSGRIEFVDWNASTVVRSVRGSSCDEVVSGLALIAALAIEA